MAKHAGVGNAHQAMVELADHRDSMAQRREWLDLLRRSSEEAGAREGAHDIRMDLKDFGPVRKGTINIRPLTILVGPDSSGKSYAAMLAHSVLSALESGRTDEWIGRIKEKTGSAWQGGTRSTASTSIPQSWLKDIRAEAMKSIELDIGRRLEYNFNADTARLVRRGSERACITISSHNDMDIKISDKVNVKLKTPDKKIRIRLCDSPPDHLSDKKDGEITINAMRNAADIIPVLIYAHMQLANLSRFPRSRYIPAARTGIMETYKTIAASVITSQTRDRHAMRALRGVMADFVADLICITNRSGKLARIAKQMEQDLTGGSTDIARPEEGLSGITYSSNGRVIPLHMASSSASEIALLSLYIKHIAEPGQLLIIEEPEAHLDLENQAKLAHHIVLMIRAGLRVMIVTHSAYLVERLGQYVIAGMADPKKRDHVIPEYKNAHLLRGEVAPHEFYKSGSGYRIREIEMNDDVGISQENFIDVISEINDESVRLRRKLYAEQDAASNDGGEDACRTGCCQAG